MKNQIQKIVVPWDFSSHSQAALKYACQRFCGEAIKVDCVLEQPYPYELVANWTHESRGEAAKRCEADFFKEAEILVPDCSVKFQAVYGDPAEEIWRYADEIGPDFIVMSTHGRTGVEKLFMGSVAQKVIGNTRFPVILLPGKWFQEKKGTIGSTCELEAVPVEGSLDGSGVNTNAKQ